MNVEFERTIRWGWNLALVGTLAGCTTYVSPPRTRVAYVPPPPVRVETPRVYVSPPPVYVAPAEYRDNSAELVIRQEADFYEPLSPFGHWETVDNYGRCWIPAQVASDWRPYSNGRWERTEAGWYWASDEPWAWATYHYGRWDFSPIRGWFWVPQTRWAPAWVSWHRGGGYLGWAPLKPTVRLVTERPLEVDVRAIPPRAYVFVEEKRFLEPVRPATVVVNNTTIINQTVNITNVKVVNNTVINEGPRLQAIEKSSGQTVPTVSAYDLRRQAEASAKRSIPNTATGRIQAPGRNSTDTRQDPAQRLAEERARNLHLKAQEESQRNAKELERSAQRQSEQRAKELQKNAEIESQKAAKELARQAQMDAQKRAQELEQNARKEAQRHAQELQIKTQTATQQRARELEKNAQEESQRNAQELTRKAQAQAEQRDRELHRKAQDAVQHTGPAAARPAERDPTKAAKSDPRPSAARRPLVAKPDPKKRIAPRVIAPEKQSEPVKP